MDDNVLIIVNFDKICRLCLHSTGAMSDIFECCDETSLSELILCATGLEVQQSDGLPSRICHKCRFIVEMSCELQSTATKAHTLLTKAAEEFGAKNEVIENEGKESNEILECPTYAQNETAAVPTEEIYDGEMLMELNINKGEESHDSMTNSSLKSTKSIKRKTAPKNLTCQICLMSFQTEKQVETHVDAHYEGTEFTSYLLLKRPYECSQCKDGVISKKQLIVHHREHLKVNPFECKHEGCRFVGKNQDCLRHHAIVHSVRSHVCEWCGAAFKRAWELRVHTDRHGTGRPHRQKLKPPSLHCGWRGCPKLYRNESSLRAHRRAHLADRGFACPLCHVAQYTSQSLLNRHMRMHGRSRVSKCDRCSRVFADYGQFYRHRLTEHGQWQPYRCHGCHQGYKDQSKLQKHMELCELAIKMKPYIAAEESTHS